MTTTGQSDAPLRVLHVLRRMDMGGIENWLMALVRLTKPSQVDWSFLVHAREPGCHERELEAHGAHILRGDDPGRPVQYAKRLHRVLNEHGPFDAVHSHLHLFSGWVLRSVGQRVPVRIAHAHSAAESAKRGWRRRIYQWTQRRWLNRWATTGLAASQDAAVSLYGERWPEDPRWQVMTCGFDLAPFRVPHDRIAIRHSLGLPDDAVVVIHVGRLVPQKNHDRLFTVVANARRRDPRLHLVVVGDGPLREHLKQRSQEADLRGHVHLLGNRSDVPALLRAADRFCFPSTDEGLGLAAVEAQAAGLPVVMSDRVPAQAMVVPNLVQRLPLSADDHAWSDAVLAAPTSARDLALDAITRSSFNLHSGLDVLIALYRGR